MSATSTTPIDRAGLERLRDWMIDGAPPSARAGDIINTMCDRLIATGMPLDRFALFIYTLHPNIHGRAFAWRRGGGLTVRKADTAIVRSAAYRDSIAVHVMNSGNRYRCNFARGDDRPDFPDIAEIHAEGVSDYLIEPLTYTTGEMHAVSWATKEPGGFTDAQIEALEWIRGPLARLTEIYMLRLNAASLLSAYVGRGGGRRVLDGNVHRGDTERIAAAILFADIKGFTKLSNSSPADGVIDALNGFFDVLVTAVDAEDGEVLKFIGDALLAIFPVGDAGPAAASRSALAALQRAEAARAEAPDGRIGYRAAVHVGTVDYGNIGGGDRLDFTAIGPAVNLAARLLETAGRSGRDFVCSADVARDLPGCESLGDFEMKGFDGARPVFALPRFAAARSG